MFNNKWASRPRRIAAVLVGVAVSAMMLSACGGQSPSPTGGTAEGESSNAEGGVLSQERWDELVAAAEDEGEVVVYSSLSDVEDTFTRFEEAFPGISVRIERAPTAEIVTRLDQELAVKAAGGDVTMHSLPGWFAAHDTDGSFAPLQVSPENDENGWVERIDGHNYSATLATPLLLGANTDQGDPLAAADEIFDAPEDAPIAIVDPQITAAQAYQYQLWLDAYGDDFLEKLSERNVTVYTSNVPLAQDMAAGALAYGMAITPSTILSLKNEGAPVEAEIPDSDVAGILYNTAVLASAPHPNAAQVFANWLASEEGQDIIVENHSPVAVPLDVDGAVPWDSMSHPDVEVWTNEYWEKWISDEWTPYFG